MAMSPPWLVLQSDHLLVQRTVDASGVGPLSRRSLVERRGNDELREPIRPVREGSARLRPVSGHDLIRHAAVDDRVDRIDELLRMSVELLGPDEPVELAV